MPPPDQRAPHHRADGERRAACPVAVIDTGPGIPEHVLPRIFEPLFTTKSFGVGLGLPTVRQIVEQHGGTLHVESAADAGTAFTVFLPRHGEVAAHATDPAARGAAA